MHKVKVIVPITGKDEDTILKEAMVIAGTDADVVEWRFDLGKELYSFDGDIHPGDPVVNSFGGDIHPGDPVVNSVGETAQNILKHLKERMPGKALLFTIRTKRQGGEFPDKPEVYEKLTSMAIRSGCLDFVDIEDTTEHSSMDRIIALAREYGVRSIASYHNFDETPGIDEICSKFVALRDTGADILKTAYMPVTPVDVAAVLYATASFKQADDYSHEMITMSMGDLGRISRVSGAIFGSDYTFAAVGETSAPGQMPVRQVREIMDALGEPEIVGQDCSIAGECSSRSSGSTQVGGCSPLSAGGAQACDCSSRSTDGTKAEIGDHHSCSSQNLYLVGFMACGKSTVSAKLGELSGKPVFEMDQYIVDKMGISIADIFDRYGEDRFREIETETLREIRPGSGAIISTGGGAPMRDENRKVMHEQGKVVYLSVKPETVIKRLSVNQTDRPVLAGHVNLEYVTDLLGRRDPLYREAADVVLETDEMTVDEICREIVKLMH